MVSNNESSENMGSMIETVNKQSSMENAINMVRSLLPKINRRNSSWIKNKEITMYDKIHRYNCPHDTFTSQRYKIIGASITPALTKACLHFNFRKKMELL